MIEGINTNQEQPLAKKSVVISKATKAAKQQAYRGRPISEKQLLRTAKKFGEFAKDYCDAYRATYQTELSLRSTSELGNIFNQARHCARRRFDDHNKLGAPRIEKISKFAHDAHGINHAFYTVSYATHYNNLLHKKNKPIVPSFIMPPLRRGNTSTFSQMTALENSVTPVAIEEPIDLRDSLSDSSENNLINMLCDLKRQNEFAADMIIEVPRSVIFSSKVKANNSNQIDNSTMNSYESTPPKIGLHQ